MAACIALTEGLGSAVCAIVGAIANSVLRDLIGEYVEGQCLYVSLTIRGTHLTLSIAELMVHFSESFLACRTSDAAS